MAGALRRHLALEPAITKLAQGLQLWAAQQQQPGQPPLVRACQAAAEAVVALLLQQLAAGDTSAGEEAGKRQLWWQQVGPGASLLQPPNNALPGTLQLFACKMQRCLTPCPACPAPPRPPRPRPQVADATTLDGTKFTDGNDEEQGQAPSQQQLEGFCVQQLQQLGQGQQGRKQGGRRGQPGGAAAAGGGAQAPSMLEMLCALEVAACKHFKAEGFEQLVKGWWAGPVPPSLLAMVQASGRLRAALEAALEAAQQAWASSQQQSAEGAEAAAAAASEDVSKGDQQQAEQQEAAKGAAGAADPAAVAAAVRAQQHLPQEAAAPAAAGSPEEQAAAVLGQLLQALAALEAGTAAHLGLDKQQPQPGGAAAFSLLSFLGQGGGGGSSSSGSGSPVQAAVQAALLPLLSGTVAAGGLAGPAAAAASLQELRGFCQQALAAAGFAPALPGSGEQHEVSPDTVQAVEAAACAHFGVPEFERLGQGPAARFLQGLLAAGQGPGEAAQQPLYAEALLASQEAELQPSRPHKASEAAVLALQQQQQAAGARGAGSSPLRAVAPLAELQSCSLWHLLWQQKHGSLPEHAASAAAQVGAGRRLLQLGRLQQHAWVDATATADDVAQCIAAGDGAGAAAALVGVLAGHGGLAAAPIELLRALCGPASHKLVQAAAAGVVPPGLYSLGVLSALPAAFRRRGALLELLLPPAVCSAEAAGGWSTEAGAAAKRWMYAARAHSAPHRPASDLACPWRAGALKLLDALPLSPQLAAPQLLAAVWEAGHLLGVPAWISHHTSAALRPGRSGPGAPAAAAARAAPVPGQHPAAVHQASEAAAAALAGTAAPGGHPTALAAAQQAAAGIDAAAAGPGAASSSSASASVAAPGDLSEEQARAVIESIRRCAPLPSPPCPAAATSARPAACAGSGAEPAPAGLLLLAHLPGAHCCRRRCRRRRDEFGEGLQLAPDAAAVMARQRARLQRAVGRLAVDLYSEQLHLLQELLQNADDCRCARWQGRAGARGEGEAMAGPWLG